MRNLALMDAMTRLRLLTGSVRPFLWGKLYDAIAVRLASAAAKRSIPVERDAQRILKADVFPLPSDRWCQAHGPRVIAFAERSAAGIVDAYGITEWLPTQADPPAPDIRCVHELSRLHPVCAMALAAHLDPQRRDYWLETAERTIVDFLGRWPANHGVHWLFPMGISLRIVSIVVAVSWMRAAGWNHGGAAERIAAGIVEHAILVAARREHSGGMTTSHYLANMLGLFVAGCALVGDERAQRWRTEAWEALSAERVRQILADGCTNEASSGYHRQVTDILLVAAHIYVAHTGKPLPPAWVVTLQRMTTLLMTFDDLGYPLLGDNDDGQAIKLLGFAPDCSFMADMASRLGLHIDPQRSAMAAWPLAGIGILRSDRMTVLARAGGIGQYGKGGHAHNDQLQALLWVDGRPIVVDPGSSTYTGNPSQRNLERSVHNHATCTVDDAEQNLWPDDLSEGLFWMMGDRFRAGVHEFRPGFWRAVSAFTGQERTISFAGQTCTITDMAPLGRQLRITLPLHPDVHAERAGDGVVLHAGTVRIAVAFPPSGLVDIVACACSPAFATLQPTTKVVWTGPGPRAEWTIAVAKD